MKCVKIQCVVVGDASVGQKSLLQAYKNMNNLKNTSNKKTEYGRLVKNNNNNIIVNNILVYLKICTTAGLYTKRRVSAYKKADIFVICFSIDNLKSLENVKKKWYPELRRHKQHIPIILVGTKQDLRQSQNIKIEIIRDDQGFRVSNEIDAEQYLECSSLNQEGVQKVFDTCVKFVVEQMPKNKEQCAIL